jgi:hypothetical protein
VTKLALTVDDYRIYQLRSLPISFNILYHALLQVMSAACRASTLPSLSTLPAAHLLRQMTDNNLMDCRRFKRVYVGFIAIFILLLPAVMAIALGMASLQIYPRYVLPHLLLTLIPLLTTHTDSTS